MFPIDVLIDKAHGRLVIGELTYEVSTLLVSRLNANSDLAAFSTSWFRRREAPPKPAFTVRALRARTVKAKGASSKPTLPLPNPELPRRIGNSINGYSKVVGQATPTQAHQPGQSRRAAPGVDLLLVDCSIL
jgi:hypothetical protein